LDSEALDAEAVATRTGHSRWCLSDNTLPTPSTLAGHVHFLTQVNAHLGLADFTRFNEALAAGADARWAFAISRIAISALKVLILTARQRATAQRLLAHIAG